MNSLSIFNQLEEHRIRIDIANTLPAATVNGHFVIRPNPPLRYPSLELCSVFDPIRAPTLPEENEGFDARWCLDHIGVRLILKIVWDCRLVQTQRYGSRTGRTPEDQILVPSKRCCRGVQIVFSLAIRADDLHGYYS